MYWCSFTLTSDPWNVRCINPFRSSSGPASVLLSCRTAPNDKNAYSWGSSTGFPHEAQTESAGYSSIESCKIGNAVWDNVVIVSQTGPQTGSLLNFPCRAVRGAAAGGGAGHRSAAGRWRFDPVEKHDDTGGAGQAESGRGLRTRGPHVHRRTHPADDHNEY
jgi:hypothetical protein